jgi:hypothetical protein
MSELKDTIISELENSEVAEIIVTLAAVVYLASVELGYLPKENTLYMLAIVVIGAAVGVDSLYKKYKRRTGE